MWKDLTMAQKSELIGMAVKHGVTSLEEIRNIYDEGGSLNPYSAGRMTDTIYENAKRVEQLGTPSHNYDFTQSEEWMNAHGYYKDNRGHRDDRVKKPAHPTHQSRGTWNGDRFQLTELGMKDPNYTMFGMADGGQDPQAILTYKNGIVLPELTVTPKGSYIHNSYDNINIYNRGGHLLEDGGPTTTGIWDFITSLGRTPIGTKEYTSDTPFKKAFREARNAGDNVFIHNGKRYNTDIGPDEYVEKVKASNPTTLRGIASRKLQIREPDKYRGLEGIKLDEAVGKHSFMQTIPFQKQINYDDINDAVSSLYDAGLSTNQIAAMLGNSLSESSWINRKQTNGTATGFYQMEPSERAKYNEYLKKNKLKGSLRDESAYIADLLKNRDSNIDTPYTRAIKRAGENFDTTVYRTASRPEYKGYTTDNALADWDSNTVDGATRAFLSMYERAGKPELDRRYFLSNLILEDPNINWRK